MWALGIILYQLVASKTHPFVDKDNSYALIRNIENNKPAPLPPSVSPFI
jgi:serine/threonine protein kinase